MRRDTSRESRPGARPARVDDPQVLARIQEALQGLQHGQVTVIVQDGVVVQVERTEKLRLPRAPGEP
jgi:hypothetical protein